MSEDYKKWSQEYRAEANKIYSLIFDLTEQKKKTRNPDKIYEINSKLTFYRSVLRDLRLSAQTLNDRAKEIEKKKEG